MTPRVALVPVTPTVELNTLAMRRGETATYTFLDQKSNQNGSSSYAAKFAHKRSELIFYHFNWDFIRKKKHFAGTGIWTHNLLTLAFLPGFASLPLITLAPLIYSGDLRAVTNPAHMVLGNSTQSWLIQYSWRATASLKSLCTLLLFERVYVLAFIHFNYPSLAPRSLW